MKKVNISYVDYFLSPLSGGADIDEDIITYASIDSEDENSVKKVIQSVLQPEFEKKSSDFKEEAKRSLSYYLTTNKVDFGRIFNSNLLPFNAPSSPKDFFIWIWEVIFKNESYKMENFNECIEDNDVNAPLKLLML